MKKKIVLLAFTLSSLSFANGGPYMSGTEHPDTIDSKQDSSERLKESRQKMQDNPRNPAMVDGFENVSSEKETKPDKAEKKSK